MDCKTVCHRHFIPVIFAAVSTKTDATCLTAEVDLLQCSCKW